MIVYVALADVHGKGSIEKTTDGGQTWSPVGPLPDQLSVIALLIDPSNASFLYAATADGVFKSSDGAATWSRVLDTPSRCLAVAPANSAVLYAGAGDGVSASLDAGASWTVTKAGLIATSVRELLVNPRSRNELYARSGLKVFRSADGGGNWQLIEELPSDLSPAGFVLNWKNPSIQYVGPITMGGGLCTGVSRTLDGGRSWTPDEPDNRLHPEDHAGSAESRHGLCRGSVRTLEEHRQRRDLEHRAPATDVLLRDRPECAGQSLCWNYIRGDPRQPRRRRHVELDGHGTIQCPIFGRGS